MNRRILLLTTSALILGARTSFGQETLLGVEIPKLEEFMAVIADDARFESTISGVWVLREILLLSAEPNSPNDLSEGANKLNELIVNVRAARNEIIDSAKNDEKQLQLAPDVSRSVENIGEKLQQLGVQTGSVLFVHLIRSYITFIQAVGTRGPSICSIFPFRIWCSA